MTKPLDPDDQRHLKAAEGWIGLGNCIEADKELDNLTASLRAHPKVQEFRWEVYANLEKWAGALDIASVIVQLAP